MSTAQRRIFCDVIQISYPPCSLIVEECYEGKEIFRNPAGSDFGIGICVVRDSSGGAGAGKRDKY